jgi:hypothetical protein
VDGVLNPREAHVREGGRETGPTISPEIKTDMVVDTKPDDRLAPIPMVDGPGRQGSGEGLGLVNDRDAREAAAREAVDRAYATNEARADIDSAYDGATHGGDVERLTVTDAQDRPSGAATVDTSGGVRRLTNFEAADPASAHTLLDQAQQGGDVRLEFHDHPSPAGDGEIDLLTDSPSTRQFWEQRQTDAPWVQRERGSLERLEPYSAPEAWVGAINGPREPGDVARENNCVDAARSAERAWLGRPERARDNPVGYDPESVPLAAVMQDMSEDDIAAQLTDAGHGAAAQVDVYWTTGDGHRFNAFNHRGEIVWVDAQAGLSAGWPPRYELFGKEVAQTQATITHRPEVTA